NVPLAERSCERNVIACGLGLAGFSLVTLGCGLAGLLSRPLLGGLLAACALGEAALRLRAHARAPSGVRPSWKTWVLALALAGPFLLCMLLGSLLPETDFDVKAYHFEGPKEWYQAGRISFLPHNVYTSFPFLTEMLVLLGMVLYEDWYWG